MRKFTSRKNDSNGLIFGLFQNFGFEIALTFVFFFCRTVSKIGWNRNVTKSTLNLPFYKSSEQSGQKVAPSQKFRLRRPKTEPKKIGSFFPVQNFFSPTEKRFRSNKFCFLLPPKPTSMNFNSSWFLLKFFGGMRKLDCDQAFDRKI